MVLFEAIVVTGVVSILAITRKYRLTFRGGIIDPSKYVVLIKPWINVTDERCSDCRDFDGGALCHCWQIRATYPEEEAEG